MELKLNIGLDEIRFGMTQAKIESLIGKPDKAWLDEDDDNQVHAEWWPLKLRLTFYEKENKRLGYVFTTNPSLHFEGTPIIDKKMDFVKNVISKKLNLAWEIEDYGIWSYHFNNAHWLGLHESFGALEAVEMGVPFKNDDEYNWPSV